MSAKEVVLDGSRWRVGDGSKVKVWGDNWFLNNVGFKVISASRGMNHETLVDELIDTDLGCWKTSLLKEWFESWEASKIASISI